MKKCFQFSLNHSKYVFEIPVNGVPHAPFQHNNIHCFILRNAQLDSKEVVLLNRELFTIANQFENALRNSNEFINLLRRYEEVNANPAAKQLFNTFNQLQMSGQEVTQQEVDTLQNLTARIQQDEKLSGLMEADFHLNTLVMDLNKKILKPVEELYAHSQGGNTESNHPGQNIRYY
jgi:cell fate (sporulation/competence/biofilm development) regulator YlbF (YheA/YmcA/DUF963 family)